MTYLFFSRPASLTLLVHVDNGRIGVGWECITNHFSFTFILRIQDGNTGECNRKIFL
jgi:expansin (peptidoglycan-binding protein)